MDEVRPAPTRSPGLRPDYPLRTARLRLRPFRPGDLDDQGRGYAGEAAEVVLRLGFADLGLHRIIGRCDPRNLPSARLLARLGMRREAHFIHNERFKGEWGDDLVYAILEHGGTASRQPAGPA